MIEPTKPDRETPANVRQSDPARVQRDDTLKKKIGTIIKKHPDKSLSVIRRWLHNA